MANFKSAAAATFTETGDGVCAPASNGKIMRGSHTAARHFERCILVQCIVICPPPHADAGEHASSHTKDHYFGGFHQCRGALAGFEAHFAGRVRGDDGGDVLFADVHGDLCEQSAEFDARDAPDQLVPAADFAKVATALAWI